MSCRKDNVERLEIACDKIRLKILKILSKSGNYASKIAREPQMERKTTFWHLKKLEDAGLIEGYILDKNKVKTPVATREYNLTSKA